MSEGGPIAFNMQMEAAITGELTSQSAILVCLEIIANLPRLKLYRSAVGIGLTLFGLTLTLSILSLYPLFLFLLLPPLVPFPFFPLFFSFSFQF